jgi:hypothetical protein
VQKALEVIDRRFARDVREEVVRAVEKAEGVLMVRPAEVKALTCPPSRE